MTREEKWAKEIKADFDELSQVSPEEYRRKSVLMVNRLLELAPVLAEAYTNKSKRAMTGETESTVNELARCAKSGDRAADDDYGDDTLLYYMEDGGPHGLLIRLRTSKDGHRHSCHTSHWATHDLLAMLNEQEQNFMRLVKVKAEHQYQVKVVKNAKKFLDAIGVGVSEIKVD